MMQNLTKSVENNSEDIQNIKNNNTGGSGNIDSGSIQALENKINNLTNKDNTNNLFLKIYPVGSIFVTNSSTNPGSIFGGTWVAFGAGRTLVGVDSSQTEFASVGLTGGEKVHTLTIDEMPSHSHYMYSVFHETSVPQTYSYYLLGTGDSDSFGTENHKSTETGSSQPHNNLQPYITVYMWKRTA